MKVGEGIISVEPYVLAQAYQGVYIKPGDSDTQSYIVGLWEKFGELYWEDEQRYKPIDLRFSVQALERITRCVANYQAAMYLEWIEPIPYRPTKRSA